MDDLKTYFPETINDAPLPNQQEASYSSSQTESNGVISTTKIANNSFPNKRTAVELISTALNTKSKKILQEFSFTESGAIQIGKYDNGVSGDVRITPAGITARDTTGITTFAIDGETGSAVFKGTVQAGTLIGGEVIVGDNNVVIDGENKHILINDGTHDRIIIGNLTV